MPATVQFILGRANAGKTYAITELLRADMAAGRRAVLIVPEQFTYEAERVLSERLGGLLGIQVLSFERLAVRATGAQDRPLLSPQGRRMLMRRTALELAPKLQAFGSVARRAGFAARMDELFSLTKRYEIKPEELMAAAKRLNGEPALAAKLFDMARLFAAVQAYLDANNLDIEDALKAFLKSVPHSFLAGAKVYVDGLEVFNPQIEAVFASLMRHCAQMTISLCMDPRADAEDAVLFQPERRVYDRLRAIAADAGCAVTILALTEDRPGRNAALMYLERVLFAHGMPAYEEDFTSIHITGATDRMAEVEAMADCVQALAQSGVRYRDMAVMAPDMGAYALSVQRAFAQRDIPLFFDARRSMQGHPAVELLQAAARVAANGYSRTELIRIAKTGLAGVTQEQAEAFENYCLRRGLLGGKRFLEPFPPEEAEAETGRAALMPPLITLREAFMGTAADMTRALYAYLQTLDVHTQLTDMVHNLLAAQRHALVEEHAQVWEILMEMLGQLFAILGAVEMRKREYVEVLDEALSAYQVGIIPATADQVLFGEFARTHTHAVHTLFVLGCNEGIFPRPQLDDELLDDEELSRLRELGLSPWEDTAARAAGERLLLYRALSKAKEQMYFSFAYADGRKELVRATLLDRILEVFPTVREKPVLDLLQRVGLPMSERGGFAALLRNIDKKTPQYVALRRYYSNAPAYAGPLQRAEAFAASPAAPESLGPALAKQLYGNKLHSSISRLETYRACPFRHFALYAMEAAPRREFRERRADIGNFSHQALDAFVRAVKAGGLSFETITEEQANGLLDTLLPEILERYEDGLLSSTARARMLSTFWADAVRTTALAMCRMLRAGSFRPILTEARFGAQGELPPIVAGPAVLQGKIDRIDAAEGTEGTYLRVVDYKTGTADINFAQIADGLSLQLAVYLQAALQAAASAGGGSGAPSPAGLYYQPVRDPAADETDESAAEKKLRPAGLLLEDADALYATAPDADSRRAVSKSTLLSREEMDTLLEYSICRAGELASELLAGRVAANPVRRGRGTTCTYCEYGGACRFDVRLKSCNIRSVRPCTREEFFQRAGQRVGTRRAGLEEKRGPQR